MSYLGGSREAPRAGMFPGSAHFGAGMGSQRDISIQMYSLPFIPFPSCGGLGGASDDLRSCCADRAKSHVLASRWGLQRRLTSFMSPYRVPLPTQGCAELGKLKRE